MHVHQVHDVRAYEVVHVLSTAALTVQSTDATLVLLHIHHAPKSVSELGVVVCILQRGERLCYVQVSIQIIRIAHVTHVLALLKLPDEL